MFCETLAHHFAYLGTCRCLLGNLSSLTETCLASVRNSQVFLLGRKLYIHVKFHFFQNFGANPNLIQNCSSTITFTSLFTYASYCRAHQPTLGAYLAPHLPPFSTVNSNINIGLSFFILLHLTLCSSPIIIAVYWIV